MTTAIPNEHTFWATGRKISNGADSMIIIANCPHCGAPLYAPDVWMGIEPPSVVHTCECRFRSTMMGHHTITEGTGKAPPGLDLAPGSTFLGHEQGMINLYTGQIRPLTDEEQLARSRVLAE